MGKIAAPIDSLNSPIWIENDFIFPEAVLAEVEACPLNVSPNAANTSSVVAPFSIRLAKAGSNFFSGPSCPLNAFDRASDTAPKSLPVPAEMSNARPNKSCALVTSPVPLTSLSKAGRNSSSATAAAMEVLVINDSTLATWASVAPVVFLRVTPSFWAAASSSMNAFTASPPATARKPKAAVAGTAALLIANCAFCPAVSRFLNSLTARSIPLAFNSVTIGIEIAIRSPSCFG